MALRPHFSERLPILFMKHDHFISFHYTTGIDIFIQHFKISEIYVSIMQGDPLAYVVECYNLDESKILGQSGACVCVVKNSLDIGI